jgi:hypothetical protein
MGETNVNPAIAAVATKTETLLNWRMTLTSFQITRSVMTRPKRSTGAAASNRGRRGAWEYHGPWLERS